MSIIELPSGLSGEVRGLSGKDGRFLSNEKLIQDNQIEDYVLKNCWLATADGGPYLFENGSVNWGDVLVGDRLVAIVHIRQATYPDDDYDLPIKCPVNTCGFRFHWEVDLSELLRLKMKKLPESSKEVMKTGGRFPLVIPGSNAKATFGLNTANSRRGFMKWQEQLKIKAQQDRKQGKAEMTNDLVNGTAFWTLQVEGIDNLLKRQEFLEDLPLGTLLKLRNQIEEADCGLDTEIEIECPKCSVSWKIDLPFTREFFAPKMKKTQAKSSETTESVEPGESP